MKVYSFPRGGISFHDSTAPQRKKSKAAYLPTISIIPLIQYPGGIVSPLVSTGDKVTEGMLVGKGINQGSANIHATVPGRVLNNIKWNDSEGRPIEALAIRMEGVFKHLGKTQENFLKDNLSHNDLQKILSDCGIVEMEGSGEPVADKLEDFRNSGKPQTLVVRCVFDDPWLSADYILCKERKKAVVESCNIIAKTNNKIERVIFAVSKKEKQLGLEMLEEAAKYNLPASMILTGSHYPQRNKREMELVLKIYEKKEKMKLGQFLILGPATLAAVYDAVKYRRPILERYVALGGCAIRKPCIVRVRVGKRIGDLIEENGGFIENPVRVIAGSPLYGKRIINLDEPVMKTTYAIYAALKANTDGEKHDCISCGECRNVCPVALDPEELYKQVMIFGAAQCSKDCHGCGCCELVCPSRLPLSYTIMGINKRQNDG